MHCILVVKGEGNLAFLGRGRYLRRLFHGLPDKLWEIRIAAQIF